MNKPLFIFEMANNHMGNVSHGLATISAMHEVCKGFGAVFDFAFKLQYRDLDTFVHRSMRGRGDLNKYVRRFEETRLSDRDYRLLVDEMVAQGFRTVCTPFDERSVDRIEAHAIDVIKVASCSFNDWPLLERIAQTDKPVIASCATASLEEIDEVTNFFLHRGKDLTLMHCVANYPTVDEDLQINQIGILRQRYPQVRIGYSTHESPDNTIAVGLAIAQGAEVFEKHVVLPTEEYGRNNYSADPSQIHAWLSAARNALAMCGSRERYEASEKEKTTLHSLRRGVFAVCDIAPGTELDGSMIEFAFPPEADQITANDWSKYTRFITLEPIVAGQPVMHSNVRECHIRPQVLEIVNSVKGLLESANVVIPEDSILEISHHYGIDKFAQFGVTMLNVVNREYCKKLMVMLPGQTHPEQYHKEKVETFIVLYGRMTLRLDGVEKEVGAGDMITIERNVKHLFKTDGGVVFEEISSRHEQGDSYYTDQRIMRNPQRKTLLNYWH